MITEAGRPSARQTKYRDEVFEFFTTQNLIYRDYREQLRILMIEAKYEIERRLMSISATRWEKGMLFEIDSIVDDVINKYYSQYTVTINRGLADSTVNGIEVVMEPMKDNLNVSLMVDEPRIFRPAIMDDLVLARVKDIGLKITRVSADAKAIIRQAIFGNLSGLDTQQTTINNIMRVLTTEAGNLSGALRPLTRSWTIFRTETLRMHSMATEHQMELSREFLTNPEKEWIHGVYIAGGSYTPREGHVLMSGQKVTLDDRFVNPFTGVSFMFPRDPEAPASEVINCGCAHVLVMPDDSYLRDYTTILV